MKKAILIIIIVLLLALGVYFLLKRGYGPPTPATNQPALPSEKVEPEKTPSVTPEVTNEEVVPEKEKEEVKPEEPKTEVPTLRIKELSVSGTEFSLSPSTLSVNKGDKVKIIFKNNGKVIHNLSIEGLGATKNINPGETDSIEFTALRSGTYNFYCSISGHREAGMEGALTIQ